MLHKVLPAWLLLCSGTSHPPPRSVDRRRRHAGRLPATMVLRAPAAVRSAPAPRAPPRRRASTSTLTDRRQLAVQPPRHCWPGAIRVTLERALNRLRNEKEEGCIGSSVLGQEGVGRLGQLGCWASTGYREGGAVQNSRLTFVLFGLNFFLFFDVHI